ncbi:MAG: cobyrinate a,c-diamide synthase [Peptococcaceae bacterium]|nr:cobyrinate a,c-diamide synthase [Peptococcaceae bacterium]
MNHKTEQTENISIPRIVVAAVQGRSGKTTFTIGLLRALRERGLLLQGYKKGPDYIDPSWSTFASGVQCRNLDGVMMTKAQIVHSFCKHAQDKDIAIVEGAMGIYDGLDWQGSNSTAELAVTLGAPVILVVSGQRITRSVAAIVSGVINFDKRVHIAGVVLNQVARNRHQDMMTKCIEEYCHVPVLGAIPKASDIEIPDRHLGLIPAGEQDALRERIDRLGQLIEDNVDIDAILKIAADAPAIALPSNVIRVEKKPAVVKIGMFKDRAFSFYYPENIEALEEAGAEIVAIDAINDAHLPEIDGLYIGGGFPEIFAQDLEKNLTMRQSVKNAAEAGMPIYAECGGLMYLSKAVESENNHYQMAGVFDGVVSMQKRPVGHGFAFQKPTAANPYFSPDTLVKGHEFHHSKILLPQEPSDYHWAFETQRGKGITTNGEQTVDGLLYKNTLATYHHFHAASSDEWAKSFIQLAEAFHKNK